jgi:hypothetical protein
MPKVKTPRKSMPNMPLRRMRDRQLADALEFMPKDAFDKLVRDVQAGRQATGEQAFVDAVLREASRRSKRNFLLIPRT